MLLERMKRIFLIFSLFLVFISCESNLTFDNIELNITPAITAPLVSFELDGTSFFDFSNTTQITIPTDTSRYTFFRESLIKDNIDRFDIYFEVNNQFDRDFGFEVVFLDENNVRMHTLVPFITPANTDDFNANRSIDISKVPDFLNTEKLTVNIILAPGPSPIDPNQFQFIKLKSYGEIFLSF